MEREERIARRLAALDSLVAFGQEMRRKYPPRPGDMSAAEWVRWDRDHRDEEKWTRSLATQTRLAHEAPDDE